MIDHTPRSPSGSHDAYAQQATVFPLGALLTVTGSLAALGGYALPWYRTDGARQVTITGVGSASDPLFTMNTNRLDWMIAVAATAALILGACRLWGRADARWVRAHTIVAVLAVVGIAFTLSAVPDDLQLDIGAIVSCAGAAILIAGLLASRRELAHHSARA